MTMATTAAPSRGTKPRRWWIWPLIAALMAAYALLFGEMFLRLLAPQAMVPRYVTGGADGVRANIPGSSFRHWTPEVDVTIRYNAAGMRDDRPAPPPARAAGECRIALLGDSYFAGFESSWDNSFAARLEEALKARGHGCRVLNFAVSGFGPAENLVILDSRVKEWQPDLVLMSLHMTDGDDNLRADLFRLEDDRLVPTGKPYLPAVAISNRLQQIPLYLWAQQNSHFYSAVREAAGGAGKRLLASMRKAVDGLRGTGAAPAPAGDEAADAPKQAHFTGNMALNRAIIDAIDEKNRSMGARLMLFEIPSSGGRMRYVRVSEDLVGPDMLARIPHATPLPRFQAMQSPEVQLYLERGHRHWTVLGNRVAADVAADAIIARDLLPAPASAGAGAATATG